MKYIYIYIYNMHNNIYNDIYIYHIYVYIYIYIYIYDNTKSVFKTSECWKIAYQMPLAFNSACF